MEQFVIVALFVGSLIMTLAAVRGMLGLLIHLMALGRRVDQVTTSHRHTPASL